MISDHELASRYLNVVFAVWNWINLWYETHQVQVPFYKNFHILQRNEFEEVKLKRRIKKAKHWEVNSRKKAETRSVSLDGIKFVPSNTIESFRKKCDFCIFFFCSFCLFVDPTLMKDPGSLNQWKKSEFQPWPKDLIVLCLWNEQKFVYSVKIDLSKILFKVVRVSDMKVPFLSIHPESIARYAASTELLEVRRRLLLEDQRRKDCVDQQSSSRSAKHSLRHSAK